MYPFSTAAAGWEPGSPERLLSQNNSIRRTSAVAVKVRKVRSVVGYATDDTSSWADRSLDSDPIKECDLSVSLRGGEQM